MVRTPIPALVISPAPTPWCVCYIMPQKPVECMRRPILNNSSPGQAVYEPFMGSGTTLIAAETTGRVCLGIELNPAYVDVAVERWQRFTGKVAVLDGSGESFSDVQARTGQEGTHPSASDQPSR